jgi:hypothetical protein
MIKDCNFGSNFIYPLQGKALGGIVSQGGGPAGGGAGRRQEKAKKQRAK